MQKWLKSYFKKNFLGYFYPPNLPMQKIGSKWSLNRFLRGGALKAPPPTRCQFQRPLLVGLTVQSTIKIGDRYILNEITFYKLGHKKCKLSCFYTGYSDYTGCS